MELVLKSPLVPGKQSVTHADPCGKQVAEYLQMSDDKIYDMAKKGELPAVKIRQQWRFDRGEIDQWLKDHRANRETRNEK